MLRKPGKSSVKLLFALGAAAILASACNSPGQMRTREAGQAATTPGTTPGLSLRVDLFPYALVGDTFPRDDAAADQRPDQRTGHDVGGPVRVVVHACEADQPGQGVGGRGDPELVRVGADHGGHGEGLRRVSGRKREVAATEGMEVERIRGRVGPRPSDDGLEGRRDDAAR
jgi:hypothetical protein